MVDGYYCKISWAVIISSLPFWILVALSTPGESILLTVEYWRDFLFWPYYVACVAREGGPYGSAIMWNALFGLFITMLLLLPFWLSRKVHLRLFCVCLASLVWNLYGFAIAILSRYD